MMDRTEGIIACAIKSVYGDETKITYQSEEINMAAPFKRMTMSQAVKEHTGLDFDSIKTDEEARAAVKKIGIETNGKETWGDLLYKVFDERAEDKLVDPVFITMHPVEVSPLAKRLPEDPRLTERFELFIARREIANAFSELNDPIDQMERFSRQAAMRLSGDEEASMMDSDYVCALEYAMPPTGGCGIGIDRLVMLLTDSASIREVILFPTMKPIEEQS
jgi:lysyl-tRNA synthetase class 2